MPRLIDLSHTIATGMTVYPGDPSVTVASALTVEEHGVAVSSLMLGSHSGTHLDAPSHTIPGGRTLDDIALDELVGEAVVVRIHDARPFEALGVARLESAGLAGASRLPSIVAVDTGWCRHFGSPEYLRHPFLTREAAVWFRERGVHVLAVDTLSPDRTPDTDGEAPDFPVHEEILGNDGLIVENLRGLSRVNELARIGFFPLNLGAIDGAPVRAVAHL